MEKFSAKTAFIVVIVSLFIAKYSSDIKRLKAQQIPVQVTENSTQVPTINPQSQAEQPEQQMQDWHVEPSIASPSQPNRLIATLEQDFYEQINEYRMSHHLRPLALDRRISEQARHHSQAMASGQVPFGDQGFDLRGEAISQKIPYKKIAEIVTYNLGYKDPAGAAVESLHKDGDRYLSTVTGEYDLTGVGVAKNLKGEYYFTQIFVRHQ